MGGGYSLSLAVNSPDILAWVIYYGRLLTDKDQLRRIKASVIGFFGEEDKGIPPASVKTFEKDMRSMGKDVSTYIYRDTHLLMSKGLHITQRLQRIRGIKHLLF